MSSAIPPFKERLDRALASETMPAALGRALSAFKDRRLEAFAGEDFGEVQERLGRIKAEALERLPELVDQFVREAEKVDSVVHRAETAADACRIVGEIASRHGARLVVKSKSMVSEEIEINHHLEGLGLRVVETDLGEYIIQLAHDRPSHLIAPAIHWTREQIAELFSAELGKDVPPEVADLVRVARAQLRQDFVDADVGITGANLLIADTGTVVVVSNEGNGRLVSTLPPVHVVLAGVEKVVPSLDEASQILKVLARNATGQKMTSYVSFMTGPSRSADIELTLATGVHGPTEQHIILLDNGRWRARQDPELRDALRCIKCGACANVCPAYREVGGHAFGHVYTGPIGLVLTAVHHGLEHAVGPQSLCVGCNACEGVCPVGIPIPRQILDVRQRVVERHGLPLEKRAVIGTLTDGRARAVAKMAQAPFLDGDGWIRNLPLAAGLVSWRTLPGLAERPLRERLADLASSSPARPPAPSPAQSSPSPTPLRVAYFPGCLTEHLRSGMGEAVVKVLRAAGCEVSLIEGWRCCGLVASNAGDRRAALKLAKETVAALEEAGADYVVSSSTSCLVMMLQDYPHLFRDEPEWRLRAERLAGKLVDFARFVDSVAPLPPGSLRRERQSNGRGGAVTYHDACQSFNCLGLGAEARRVLGEVLEFEVREMADSSVCCGFGGTFSLEHPRVAQRILARKLEHAFATGADTLVTDNPGCVMHLRGGMDRSGCSMRVLHLAEAMAERLRD